MSLDYAGACLPAHAVGGDYYDFLSLGPDRLGLVIGDVMGKGIAAALLMANLQANLRRQVAFALRASGRAWSGRSRTWRKPACESIGRSLALVAFLSFGQVAQLCIPVGFQSGAGCR